MQGTVSLGGDTLAFVFGRQGVGERTKKGSRVSFWGSPATKPRDLSGARRVLPARELPRPLLSPVWDAQLVQGPQGTACEASTRPSASGPNVSVPRSQQAQRCCLTLVALELLPHP